MIHSRLWYIRITIHSLILSTTIAVSACGKLYLYSFAVLLSTQRSSECLQEFLFSNLLYFVYDLFPLIACSISMHSTPTVITSHSVSSPWLYLSSLYFFSHLLLVVPIWVCVKYSSFCLLLCHTHTQLHQLFPQLLIHYFVKYQWKRTQHKLKKKMLIPFLIRQALPLL